MDGCVGLRANENTLHLGYEHQIVTSFLCIHHTYRLSSLAIKSHASSPLADDFYTHTTWQSFKPDTQSLKQNSAP